MASNKPEGANPAMASRLAAVPHWRRVAAPGRYGCMNVARVKRLGVASVLVILLASAAYRAWLQFRPLPISICVSRPGSQVEWERLMRTNSPAPSRFFMTDYYRYPGTNEAFHLSTWDLLQIRALGSWGAVFPYRTTAVDVWSRTNVCLRTYERRTMELQFTKDALGWHMKPHLGTICYYSETDEPFFSFH